MLRILIAALAVTFLAGTAWAANDAMSETDAIQLDQGDDPNAPPAKKGAPGPTGDLELQELDREMNQ